MSASLAIDHISSHSAWLQPKQETESRVSSILNSLPAAILILDHQGMIVEQNEMAQHWLEENLIGQMWANTLEKHFEMSADQQDLRIKNGRIVSISTNPLESAKGQTILLTDVTEQRKLQAKQNHQSRLVLMGEMLATLAHQVRTPLTSSLLYFSQAKMGTLSPELQKNFIQKGLDNLRHLESMISELLMFSKGGQFNASWVSVDKAISFCQQQLTPLLKKHSSVLQVSNSNSALAKANDDALASAIINLVENAVVHNERPVEVNIQVSETFNQVLIVVQNNGIAINDEVIDAIFTPFMTTRSNGTGLGLSIVKTIIESFGGSIRLNRNVDGEVSFLITLEKQIMGALA